MKKKGTRLLALLLAAMMVLTACGGGGDDKKTDEPSTPSTSTDGETPSTPATPTEPAPAGNEGEPIKDYVTYQSASGEMSKFLVLYSESAGDLDYLCNVVSGLLEVNNKGQFIPAIAKEWGTEDGGLTWTFKLRDDVTWVDVNGNEKAKCTAQDWATSLEWILNFHKNAAYNSSMPCQMIKGAQEYYDTVNAMDPDEAKALKATDDLFLNTVGIEIPDDYTIIYHCSKNVPYFDSLAVSAALMPLSQAQVDEVGVEEMLELDNTNMWYNGPYIMTEFIQANSKVFSRNEAYYDKECSLFDTVTVLMVDDGLVGQTMFLAGDVDECTLSESNLHTIYEDPNHEFHNNLVEGRPRKYSYQAHLNYAKRLDDGTPDVNWNTAVANEAFRKSLYYGMDLTNYWNRTNFIHPEKCENVAYTMKGLLYFSDGTDYVEHVWEKIGLPEGKGRYDADKAQQYKEQAMKELEGKVTFPVELRHFIAASNQLALDEATVIKEIVESLGTDYITVKIDTYASSARKEVYAPQRHSWSFGNGWGADYADPENFVGQELYNDNGAFYARDYSYVNDEECVTDPTLIETYKTFTQMAYDAAAIYDDMDARYEAYVDAEAYMLEHALVIPTSYSVTWALTKSNIYTKKYAMFGMQNNMWKDWQTSSEPYTTEQYAAFEAAFNAE